MASKRKFKRDYIILEAKDMNFRYKERILPKAFAKIEINEEKSIVSLYVENLKFMKDGYRVVAIKSDYETLDLGNIVLSEQGKGEFILDLENSDIEIKGVALLYEKSIPLIGFKGNKIENYEEILFTSYEDIEEDDDDFEVYEEVEYIEVEDGEDFEEYEEIEYIEIEDDEEYEEIDDDDDDEYEYEDEIEEIEEETPYIRTTPKKQRETRRNQPQYRQPQPQPQPQQYQQEPTQSEPKFEGNKSAGPLLMPRQIKKGLKVFKEVKPFLGDYIDNTRWWKIEISPITLCGYAMPHLGYVNTLNYTMYSDSVTQSYKYRHYLFGVQYDEYNKRKNYMYAIPGKKDEQPDQGHTGFRKYQPCDTRNDDLGYWICIIDSRTRKILK